MSRGPVFAAYADGALGVDCPNCKSASEAFCVFDDGSPRHVPCISRLQAAAKESR